MILFTFESKVINNFTRDTVLYRQYVAAWIDHRKPLIALVNGPAIGISVTVLGLFDLIFASDKVVLHGYWAAATECISLNEILY